MVVSAFQNISAGLLKDPDLKIECDVLVAGNKKDAQTVIDLAQQAGMTAWHRPQELAAAEALTSLLIHINGQGVVSHAGIKIVGQDEHRQPHERLHRALPLRASSFARGTILRSSSRMLWPTRSSSCSGDVVIVAQKIVSKAEGRLIRLDDVEPDADAISLATETGKDARLVQLILDESDHVVRKRQGTPERPGVIIVEHRCGWVHANAGIDQSNLEGESGGAALLLPIDCDASAARLRADLEARTGVATGIVIATAPGAHGATNLGIASDPKVEAVRMCVDDEPDLEITVVDAATSSLPLPAW